MRITTLLALFASFLLFVAPLAFAEEVADDADAAAAEEPMPPVDAEPPADADADADEAEEAAPEAE